MSDTTCPSCAEELAEGEVVAGRRELSNQTVSICRGCAEIVIVLKAGEMLALRKATASDYLSLPEEAQTLLRVAFELVRSQRIRPPRLPRHAN